MNWSRRKFKDAIVWVRLNETGQLFLDADGRAEMRYRPEDPRSYRPHPSNLGEIEGEDPRAIVRTTPVPAKPPSPEKKAAATPKVDATPGVTQIAVWTDGACTGNPGPMAIGIVILVDDQRTEHGEFLGHGTNNIAELVAIERGLELTEKAFPGIGQDKSTRITVYSDSSYSIGLLSQGWKAKANQEVVARIRSAVSRFGNLKFQKVPGHAGVPENERCDELARNAILSRH
ncbi:MAG: RNase H family protein [Deltaproteobacteria bacterium]|nr:RNase H family protein [Deltaproteobacteria bacterium]